MLSSKNWVLRREHRLSIQAQAEHDQAQAEHQQARANLGAFWHFVFRPTYHQFCKKNMRERDTFPKLDFRIHKNLKLDISQIWAFRIRYHRFCEEFMKEHDTFNDGNKDRLRLKKCAPPCMFWPTHCRRLVQCKHFQDVNDDSPVCFYLVGLGCTRDKPCMLSSTHCNKLVLSKNWENVDDDLRIH